DAGDLVQEDWEGWQTWDVDLAAFGVDLTDVTKLIIGINSGSEVTPSQDYGYVSFDDIILYPPRCKPEYVATSFNYDCTTDEDDLEVINDAWLEREYNVVAVAPVGGLQAYYMFDETSGTTAADASGNVNNATVDAAGAGAWDTTGGRGGSGCLAFDGTFGVSIPSAVFAGITDAVSISVWVKDDAAVNPESVGRAEFGAGPRDPNEWWDRVTWIQDSPEDYVGQWNHYCFVKDVSTGFMWMYHNGVMVSRDKRAAQPIGVGGWGSSKIGASTDGDSGYYVGRMDDFQIYDYALSHAEVVSLSGLSDVDQPLQPVLSPVDPVADGIINLFDIGRLGESWMLEELWP
ncbi:MAG: LamG domain-containing protein, partial [Planctomycetes bacterium]|nr:LamG domain-containing protein [Planctomycetota bacterium]